MGDWRRVQIIGTCDAAEVAALARAIRFDLNDRNQEFYCLTSTGGIAGLPLWPAEHISAVGNLAERDYDEDDVRRDLNRLAKIAPSLSVKVHVGGADEEDECVATVVLEDEVASIIGPEINDIPDIDYEQMRANFLRQMRGF